MSSPLVAQDRARAATSRSPRSRPPWRPPRPLLCQRPRRSPHVVGGPHSVEARGRTMEAHARTRALREIDGAGAGARRVPSVAARRQALHSVAPAVSRVQRDRSSVAAARRSYGQGFARSSALTRATGGSHGAAAASEYCAGCRSRCGAGRPVTAPATGLPSDCAKAPRGPERAHLPPPD